MKDLDILEECSINDIYRSNGGESVVYQIPVYQRNYAWEHDEIHALIKDVYDSMESGKCVYYIGTLVTYKRDEDVYEVIDGQQRLTTIYIILKAMAVDGIVNRLTYSARKMSAATIENLPNFVEECDRGIRQGYHYAVDELDKVVEETDMYKFEDYFLNNVRIIHYRVPKDVDLNHYFEVMNSRGEQLEKHEIVKAKLCEQLRGDDMEKFSRIWEACSDMSFYIQQKLSELNTVFGNKMDKFVLESFDGFPCSQEDTGNTFGRKSIEELLKAPLKRINRKEEYDKNDKFQPIIDFPNFLLVVLKITRIKEKDFNPLTFTLDDKELISEFEKVTITTKFVKTFAYNLLLLRYYLDNYIIHHVNSADKSDENPWKLQYYYKRDKKAAYLKDLIEDDKSKQSELVHLLSMFEVAFTARQRKNYLFYCLLHLFENDDVDDYLEFVRNLADKYFLDVYLDSEKLNEIHQPKSNSFDETIIKDGKLHVELEGMKRDFNGIYPIGSSNIPLFVFNYTDYKLWKKYADKLRGSKVKKGALERNKFFAELGCSDFELEPFNNFYFSRTRKSLEHYYPRAKAGEGHPLSSEEINCFGNFAMIGPDANSSGSNWNPIDKKNRYLDTKSNPVSVASLKFRIMLQICQDNYDKGIKDDSIKRQFGLEWNSDDMRKHQDNMLKIIMEK